MFVRSFWSFLERIERRKYFLYEQYALIHFEQESFDWNVCQITILFMKINKGYLSGMHVLLLLRLQPNRQQTQISRNQATAIPGQSMWRKNQPGYKTGALWRNKTGKIEIAEIRSCRTNHPLKADYRYCRHMFTQFIQHGGRCNPWEMRMYFRGFYMRLWDLRNWLLGKVGWSTHWGRDKTDAISQTTVSTVYPWLKYLNSD